MNSEKWYGQQIGGCKKVKNIRMTIKIKWCQKQERLKLYLGGGKGLGMIIRKVAGVEWRKRALKWRGQVTEKPEC